MDAREKLRTTFFFYFPSLLACNAARTLFQRRAFIVSEGIQSEGEWCLKLYVPLDAPDGDPELFREGFEQIAALFGGEFDGWEREVKRQDD